MAHQPAKPTGAALAVALIIIAAQAEQDRREADQ